jgi:hypothetical protein
MELGSMGCDKLYRLKSLLTSGCALMIACRLVRCGSSVYDQKKSSLGFWPTTVGVVLVEVDEETRSLFFVTRTFPCSFD